MTNGITTTPELPNPFTDTPSTGFNWGALGAGAAGGAVLGSLFGGGGDISDPIGKAGDIYQNYMQQALQKLQAEEAGGKGALGQYYQQALGFGAPYRAAGEQALQSYLGSLGLGGGAGQQTALDTFRASPGYQYALQQGLQGVQRGMAARGLGGSGAEERELQRTGQGLASQEYGQYQQRLAGLAGLGQRTGAQAAQEAMGTGGELARLGQQYGMGTAGLYGQMGQAAASAEMAKALARQRQESSFWGGLGTIAGAAAPLLF